MDFTRKLDLVRLCCALFLGSGSLFSHAQTPLPETSSPPAESDLQAFTEKVASVASDTDAEPVTAALPKVREVIEPSPDPVELAFNEELANDEIGRLQLERDLLAARAALAKEKLGAEQLDLREIIAREKFEMEQFTHRLQLEASKRKESLEGELSALRDDTERLKIEKEAAAAKVDVALHQLRLKETELKGKLSHLSLEVAAKNKEIEARLYSDANPVYLDEPLLEDGTLVISDRRIALNGVVTSRSATEISTRIQYYNNQDKEKPIFIVIDDSPGGSVMAGYHILKAMEGSDAPVYVVVKQFAASMAACITTLADRSFAYPNAVLLHHQLTSGLRGNLTQQREGLAEVEEWWRRLAEPVAKKMGVSTEEFIGQMYEKVSTGDWTEFADSARELKWVDHVVDKIRETGQEKHPDAKRVVTSTVKTMLPTPTRSLEGGQAEFESGIDTEGHPYLLLPRHNPIDKFYLHNPDGYYRFR